VISHGVPARRPATIGDRVRDARMAAGLTQERLGALVGFSRAWVVKVESSERRMSVDDVPNVALALGVGLAWLLTGDGEFKPASRSVVELREAQTMLANQARVLAAVAAKLTAVAATVGVLLGDVPPDTELPAEPPRAP